MLPPLLVPARRALATTALLLLVGLTGLGTARAGAPGRPTAAVTFTDSSVIMPASIQAGYDAFTITNAGSMPHEASFIKLAPGATLDQVIAAAQNADSPEGFAALLQLVTLYGGTDPVDPGATVSLALNLAPGTYGLGDPQHLTDGVAQLFTVTPPPSDVAPPQVSATITTREFAFDGPATLPAGQTTVQVVNRGQQSHELALMRIDPGHTVQDLVGILQQSGPDSGPPPDWVHQTRGWDAAGPGVDGTVTLDLTPGTYVMLCFLPDVATGTPHALLGMVSSFTAR